MTKPKYPRKRRLLQFVTADGELMTYAPSRYEQEWPLERLIDVFQRGQLLRQPLPRGAHDQILQHLQDLQRRLTERQGGRPAHKSLTGREQMKHSFGRAEQRADMEREIARLMKEEKLKRPAAIEKLAARSGIDPESFLKKLHRKPRL
jgi:hypothetical protein